MNELNNLTEKKKTGFSITSLVFGILGLVTPFLAVLIYIILTLDVRDDGFLAVFVIVIGLGWWTLMTVLSFVFLVAAFIRRETGRVKTFAAIAAVLSAAVIAGIIAFFVIAGSLSKY